MSTIMLVEKLGDKYLHNQYASKVRSILEIARENGDTVDLAQCMLGPDTYYAISLYYSTVDFINSADSTLDFTLRNNCSAARITPYSKSYIGEELNTPIECQGDLIAYLKELKAKAGSDPNFRLQIKGASSKVAKKKIIPLAAIIAMRLPQVNMQFDASIRDLFEFCRAHWMINCKPHDKYNQLLGLGIVEREKIDGKFKVPGDGNYSENNFVQSKVVLPSCFGSEVIYRNPEFEPLFEECVKIVVSPTNVRKRMIDFITEEK